MASNNTSWGPTYITSQDYELSKEQVSVGFGLPDTVSSDKYGIAQRRRTFRSFIRALINKMQNDPLFKGVTFTEDFPESLTQCPRVCWGLVSRRAGVQGNTHKGPQLMESWPLEDGSVLEKWVQPQLFDFSFQIFHTTSDDADNLAEDIEHWIIRNSYLVGQCGATSVFFVSEGQHEMVQNNNSQPIRKRTLYYTGTINYVYPIVIDAIKTVKVWNTSTDGLQVQTVAVTRANNSPPMAYDLLNIQNAIVFAVHTHVNSVVNDYYPNIDFNIVLQKEPTVTKAFIHWLPRGKRPDVGTEYYITFFLPYGSRTTAGVILTEDSIAEIGTPENQPTRRRGKFYRPPRVPLVLGQQVDPTDIQKGRSITFLTEDGSGMLQTVPLASNYLEALTKANVDTVALLDLTDIPPANFARPGDLNVV